MLCVDLFADRRLQPLKILKPQTDAEIIVDLRLTLLTHSLDYHLKDSWLASKMRGLIIFGKIHRHIQFVADLRTNQPILKAGNEAVRAKLE